MVQNSSFDNHDPGPISLSASHPDNIRLAGVLSMLPTTYLFTIYVFSFVVSIGAVVLSSPVSTTIVSQAPRRGWKTGPPVTVGHALMECVIVILIMLGVGVGLAHPSIWRVIAMAAGGLLIWMGALMLRAVWRGEVSLPGVDDGQKQLSSGQLIGLGMLPTGANPIWDAWWMTDPVYQVIIVMCGAFFVYLGLVFLWQGILLQQ